MVTEVGKWSSPRPQRVTEHKFSEKELIDMLRPTFSLPDTGIRIDSSGGGIDFSTGNPIERTYTIRVTEFKEPLNA